MHVYGLNCMYAGIKNKIILCYLRSCFVCFEAYLQRFVEPFPRILSVEQRIIKSLS